MEQPARQGSMVDRMIGAATLDVATYEAVEHDTTATTQAGLIIAMAAIAQGVASPYTGVIYGIISSLIGWFAMAGLVYFIGTRLFGGTATWGELLRTLGFAASPGLLYILGLIPLLGVIVTIVVGIWVLVCVVVAIRQALDVSTGKAILTGLLGMIAWALIAAIIPGL
ncbi:MAG: YIP1 family protein [Gemmatimonadota bacterium]